MNSLEIKCLGATDPGFEQVRAIRREVFINEQHVPEDEEWDEADITALHVLAHARQSDAVYATARLTREGEQLVRVGRMAVLKKYRGRGIGEAVLKFLVKTAWEQGYERIVLHSQTHAIGFYHRLGFEETGDVFLESGISHVTMVLKRDC